MAGGTLAPGSVLEALDTCVDISNLHYLNCSDRQGAELVPDNSSYGERALRSVTAPGATVEAFRFTL